MTLTGGALDIRDANDLTIAILTQKATNSSVRLEAGKTLTLSTGAIDTGSASLILISKNGPLTLPGDLSGSKITLEGSADVTVNANVTDAGDLSIKSTGGKLTLSGNLTGTGKISLEGVLGVKLGGNVTDLGNLTITATDHDIEQTAGAITVTGTTTVNAGTGTVKLDQPNNDFGFVQPSASSLVKANATTAPSSYNVTVTSPDVTISDKNFLSLDLTRTSDQKVVVAATDLVLNTKAKDLEVNFAAVTNSAAIYFESATSLNLLFNTNQVYNGKELWFYYTPGLLESMNVKVNSVLSTRGFPFSSNTTMVYEPSLSVIAPSLYFPGSTANLCDASGQCVPVNEAERVTPALTSVVVSAEREAQGQAAGIGQIAKRLKGNSIELADLVAPIEYKEQSVRRTPCVTEQEAGAATASPESCK